jgi:hypothetical protein
MLDNYAQEIPMKTFDKITLVSAKSLLEKKPLNNLVREGEKTNSLGAVFDASRELYDYLLEDNAKLNKAQNLIEKKKAAVVNFEQATGLVWRL